MRKEVWFGLSIMAAVVIMVFVLMPAPSQMTNGHLGLLMLALIVVGIMLGFPTAFTLMGMGVFFAYLSYRGVNPDLAPRQVLDLFVQRTYGVMSNDVLIAIPLFVFMGYLVERAALIDKLFRSLHLATARVPGSLAVATIVTCAIFATATGIVGAVVTLMGLLAFPAMLKAGYNVKISAGAVTAGGCLGILIPPSVLLIVYGAVAGVSVVKLYAGAFGPGFMLAALYIGYVIVLAKFRPDLMPPLPQVDRAVSLPSFAQNLRRQGSNALSGLWRVLIGTDTVEKRTVIAQMFVTLVPAFFIAATLAITYQIATSPEAVVDTTGLVQSGGLVATDVKEESTGLISQAEEDKTDVGIKEAPVERSKEVSTVASSEPAKSTTVENPPAAVERLPTPTWFWMFLAFCVVMLGVLYSLWSWERLEVFKMLLTSFFPLAILILAVLGSIVYGLATPTEAAAVGATGGLLLALAYRQLTFARLQESVYLTAKTSAMVCWLFVGSSIFSAAFALLGGQELVEQWVLGMNLTKTEFL